MSVKERIRQLELQSKTTTPIKPSRFETPASKIIEASPLPTLASVAPSPLPLESEVDTENFEDAEEERPGMYQRILFLRHPAVPVSNLFEYN